MSVALKGLAHPGPRVLPRQASVPASLRPVRGVLRAGEVLMAGIARIMAEAGCRGGVLELGGLVCDPFRYVLPALSPDAGHAAWYSATHAPAGPVRVLRATAMIGARDAAPFLHAHGLWNHADGSCHMGHVLPFDSRVAVDHPVSGLGAPGAWFEGLPDPETAFTLFAPAGGDAGGQGLLATIRPDEDVTEALEALAAAAGLAHARAHGIGSIWNPVFDDGRRIACIATEVRLVAAEIRAGRAGPVRAEIVTTQGAIHAGSLARGANPVGVTFEVLLEPLTALEPLSAAATAQESSR